MNEPKEENIDKEINKESNQSKKDDIKEEEPKLGNFNFEDLEEVEEKIIKTSKKLSNPTIQPKIMEENNNIKKEDEKELKMGLRKYQTDSMLNTKPDRKSRLQDRLKKSKMLVKKREEEAKYKQSESIKLRASLFEGKLPKKEDDKNN